jgi:23S rRNA (cytosine1962-C5)-methyltransferase
VHGRPSNDWEAKLPRKNQQQANEETAVVVSRRGANRLRLGHPWVYRSDVLSADGVSGSVVPVMDDAHNFIGTALYSSASEIAVRFVSRNRISPEAFPALARARIRRAIELRRRIVLSSEAWRVVFSEADFLPGLIIDRYGQVLSVQILTQAMDRGEVRQAIIDELVEQFAPAGIIERVDARIRELEQLPPRETGLIYGDKTSTVYIMNGVAFQYDGMGGQKTGAFLDQRENYAAAAYYAKGDALDAFCYQGGFALHLAPACSSVIGVDSSRPALESAETNAKLNARELEWIEANAFDLMKDYAAAGRQFDTIVLDPPAFAKTRRALPTAMRGYKELNLRAMKMIRPCGVLVTCSCSYHVSEQDFLEMVTSAAIDAHRQVRLIEKRGAAKDHPVLLGVPETNYLKCIIAEVE